MRHIFAVLSMLAVTAIAAIAQPCPPLTESQQLAIEGFLKTWYQIPNEQSFALIDSTTVDSACYRKLVFRPSMPAPLLTLYLTPDGSHLVGSLMDLAVDPAVARRKKQNELHQLLTSGALLTTGSTFAPLKMVVFSDFQCPYCKRFAGLVNELAPEERSSLQITYRQLPLSIHPWARDAAALGACVAIQNQSAFWKLHDYLFSEQQRLSNENVKDNALAFLSQTKEVDVANVSACLTSKSYEEYLSRDENLAADLGIRSTPTVFLNGQAIRVTSLQDLRAAMHAATDNVREALTHN